MVSPHGNDVQRLAPRVFCLLPGPAGGAKLGLHSARARRSSDAVRRAERSTRSIGDDTDPQDDHHLRRAAPSGGRRAVVLLWSWLRGPPRRPDPIPRGDYGYTVAYASHRIRAMMRSHHLPSLAVAPGRRPGGGLAGGVRAGKRRGGHAGHGRHGLQTLVGGQGLHRHRGRAAGRGGPARPGRPPRRLPPGVHDRKPLPGLRPHHGPGDPDPPLRPPPQRLPPSDVPGRRPGGAGGACRDRAGLPHGLPRGPPLQSTRTSARICSGPSSRSFGARPSRTACGNGC